MDEAVVRHTTSELMDSTDHPLRPTQAMMGETSRKLEDPVDEMDGGLGRPSTTSEPLLRAGAPEATVDSPEPEDARSSSCATPSVPMVHGSRDERGGLTGDDFCVDRDGLLVEARPGECFARR